jgi:predicted Zn-dependent peptidase
VSIVENSHERTLVDDVPVLWAEAPGPFTGALVFRAGGVDETLPTAGVSHLVEHLALFTAGTRRFTVNGFVEGTRTAFWASGTRDEVTGFLTDVARALGDLPLERLDAERRVLRTEESSSGANGPPAVLLGLRYGPHGHASSTTASSDFTSSAPTTSRPGRASASPAATPPPG